MKYISLLFCCVSLMGVTYCFASAEKAAKHGTIVILNGPSGSGKSSTQKAFQNLMIPCAWIKTGIDDLFDRAFPEINADNMEYWASENPLRWIEESQDNAGKRVITLHIGQEGRKVAFAMNRAILAYACAGCNVIVDYIAYEPEWLQDLRQLCKDEKTYFVAVKIPLDELERREEARDTSPVGHARSHYTSVYGNGVYDLEVDSGKNSPREIAEAIKSMLEK